MVDTWLVLLGSFFGVAMVLWHVWQGLRAVRHVRSGTDLVRLINGRNASLQHGLAVSEIGTGRAARESFDQSRHSAAIGLKLLATVLAPTLFYVGNTMLLDASGRNIDATVAPWLGLGLLGLVLWYLAWIWTYSIEVSGDTLRVPSLLFVRRRLPLGALEGVTDTGEYFVTLRFRGGRRARVLKYVTGRDALMTRLTEAAEPQTNDQLADAPCPSSQKSRQSAADCFRSRRGGAS